MIVAWKNLLITVDNLSDVTVKFVQLSQVPLTATSLRKALKAHPDYYGQLAFNDVLNHYAIETGPG